MAGAVINCRKCGKVFQKRATDLCPVCIQLEEEQFKILYRSLQKSASNGGIAIEELSVEVGISVEDIERFYRDGRLSTAASYLKLPCQACGVVMNEIDRRGRYCIKCSEIAATKAGVEVKSLQQLEKADEAERQRQQQLAMLKKHQTADKGVRKFGSNRRR